MSRYFVYFILLSILILSCDTSSNIEPPYNNYFFKYFGPEGNQKAVDLIVNSDGTFYILGNSKAPDSVQKIYLAHADAQGRLLKANTYGSPDKVDLDAKDFLITSDGKLAVVANKNGSNSEVWLIRFSLDLLTPISLDKDIVQLKLEFSPSANVYANSITELNDGGFVVMGYTDYVNGASDIVFDALHFRTFSNLVQFNSTNSLGWKDANGDHTIGTPPATNIGISAFQDPTGNSEVIFFGTKNATKTYKYSFWTFNVDKGSYPGDQSSLSLTSDEILASTLKTTGLGYLMTGLSVSSSNAVNLKLARCFDDILKYDSTDFNLKRVPSWSLGSYTSPGNLGLANDLFATACNSSTGNGAFIVLSNVINIDQSKDIWLMKFDSHNLLDIWTSPVIIGGDGDDSAATVVELPDGKIAVLATMSVGSPNGGISKNQYKIALLKLNAQGKLAD